MMLYCPFCGHRLPRPLLDGITSCPNCRRVFDSARFNKLLSLAWAVRKEHIDEVDFLTTKYNVCREDAAVVVAFVSDACYSHEEFYELLIANKASDGPIRLDLAG